MICGAALILAESEMGHGVSSHWVFDEFPMAIATKIESTFSINIGSYLVVVNVELTFKDFVNFQEVITIFVDLVDVDRFHGGIDFHFNDVAKFLVRIEITLATVASKMDHLVSFVKIRRGCRCHNEKSIFV